MYRRQEFQVPLHPCCSLLSKLKPPLSSSLWRVGLEHVFHIAPSALCFAAGTWQRQHMSGERPPDRKEVDSATWWWWAVFHTVSTRGVAAMPCHSQLPEVLQTLTLSPSSFSSSLHTVCKVLACKRIPLQSLQPFHDIVGSTTVRS